MRDRGTEVGTDVIGNIKTITSKSRAWLITINNYSNEEINSIKNCEGYIYKIWQLEVGKQGTPHVHCLLYSKNPRIWPKKLFPRADIQKVKFLDKCIKYVSKEDTRVDGPWEWGVKPEQGHRSDLDTIAKKYLENSEEVIENEPGMFVKYGRGLQLLKNVSFKHRDVNKPPIVIWLYGKAGTGKTSSPINIALDSNHSFYIKDESKWWDGYEQQDHIILDDFGGKMDYRNLLRLLDRYPYQGECKGSYVKINSPYIWITSEFSPNDLWEDNQLAQVVRRLKLVKELKLEDDINERLNGLKETLTLP